jgi:hypothetical protein
MLVVLENQHVRYFATFCIVSGTYTTIGLIIAWCKLNSSLSSVKRFTHHEITSCAQFRIGDEEGYWNSYVHGDWTVW